MKKTLLFISLFFALTYQIGAQNQVMLNITHKLDQEVFQMEKGAQNNIGHDFNITRLEYYISEISIIHDGGQETAINDTWILVNTSTDTEVDLGTLSISNVEKVRFHVGVNEEVNHLDPAFYPPSHPLAPKFPSMHWGWAAGYRFVAIEGNGSAQFNQLFQLHGLGDNNYFMTEVDVESKADQGVITIALDADYTRALEDISVNTGVVVHGDNAEAKQCLENFRDYVFSPSAVQTNTLDANVVKTFNIYPNPIINNKATLELELEQGTLDYTISVNNSAGLQMLQVDQAVNGTVINFDQWAKGFYFVNIEANGQTLASKKVIFR